LKNSLAEYNDPQKRPWWLLTPGRIHPLWFLGLGAVMLAFDYVTSPSTQFPVLYVLPVCLAAWYSGKWPALTLAIAVPLFRLAVIGSPAGFETPSSFFFTTVFRGAVIVVMALWVARLADLERDLVRQVKVLEGLLPICAFCKNIRNESGDWERLEQYISNRSDAEFSHGVCPSCGDTHYPGMLRES
jgi:hypothetical protein